MTLALTLAIVAATVFLIVRRVEVRLVLVGAGLALGLVAGRPLAVCDAFARALVSPMVAPICAAMGFAAVLAATGCDRDLVGLLVAPLRRARGLVLPGGVLAAYLTNLAVPSQASTAAALGPVLVPLLVAAGYGAEVAGAALVLGASFGGDLLNPSAQDVVAVAGATGIGVASLAARVGLASLAGALVAALVFAIAHRRPTGAPPARTGGASDAAGASAASPARPVRALIPLVPVALLLAANSRLGADGGPLAWFHTVPSPQRPADAHEWSRLAGVLPVVRAMLIGVLLAAAAAARDVQRVARALFEGMGAAYGGIVSLTVAAQCFGTGLALTGASDALLAAIGGRPIALGLLAVSFPWALAALSGSGSGPVLTFAQSLLAPLASRPEAATLGAAACLGGAFGRTMSPVSAVVIYGAGVAGVAPVALVRRLLPALLAGAATSLAVLALRR